MDFKNELSKRTEDINSLFEQYRINEVGPQKEIFEAMNYSFFASGKRIRPLIMQETFRMYNKNPDSIEANVLHNFMVCIESIHTYSLVHDDLPALDNDDYRRGKLTTHKKFGHAMGILAGDALLNYAYMTGIKGIAMSKDAHKTSKALSVIAYNAGEDGMIGGQVVDVNMSGKPLDIETLDFIYDKKTGALLTAAFVSGAILGGANEDDINILKEIGHLVGMAFQIQDDILDVTSSLEELGKPILSDEKNEKTTYVTIYGIDKAKDIVNELSIKAMELLKVLPENEFLLELIKYLIDRRK